MIVEYSYYLSSLFEWFVPACLAVCSKRTVTEHHVTDQLLISNLISLLDCVFSDYIKERNVVTLSEQKVVNACMRFLTSYLPVRFSIC